MKSAFEAMSILLITASISTDIAHRQGSEAEAGRVQ